MVPPPSQNIVAVCNKIALLILHCINSRVVTLHKVTDAPNIFFYLTVNFKIVDFRCQSFLLIVPEIYTSLTSYIVKLSSVLWFESSNHCILV